MKTVADLDDAAHRLGLPKYSELAQLLARLSEWAEHTGGWDSPVWHETAATASSLRRFNAAD